MLELWEEIAAEIAKEHLEAMEFIVMIRDYAEKCGFHNIGFRDIHEACEAYLRGENWK